MPLSSSDFTITFYSRASQEDTSRSRYPKQCKTTYRVPSADALAGSPVSTDISFGKTLPAFGYIDPLSTGQQSGAVAGATAVEADAGRGGDAGKSGQPVPQARAHDSGATSAAHDARQCYTTTRSGRRCTRVTRYEPQETVQDDQETSSRYSDEDEDEEDTESRDDDGLDTRTPGPPVPTGTTRA
eukprot:3660813-Pleurochrysis_carterae.AAC.2